MTTLQDAAAWFDSCCRRVVALERALPAVGWRARHDPVGVDLHLRLLREAKVAKALAHQELQELRVRHSVAPISLRHHLGPVHRAVPMVAHASSSFVIKSVNSERREIRGWATVPTPDLLNDIVEPRGAEFVLPLPLILQHQHDQPVGNVIDAEVSDAGIAIRARISNVPEEGDVKRLTDKAWHMVKHQLVNSLSIGFRPNPDAVERKADGGFIYKRWRWLELSLVTVAANQSARITAVA